MSITTPEYFLLIGAILLFLSIVSGKTGYRFGVPSLLLFLIVGIIFGSEGFGIQFNSFKQAQFIGMVALSIILFSGGMDTKIKDIKPVLTQGLLLSTLGVILTALITGLFAFAIAKFYPQYLHLSLPACFLLASVMASTDSASVFSILRTKNLNLSQNVRPLLELESGSNDPMAYMLTILFIQIIISSSAGLNLIVFNFFLQLFLGALMGAAIGYVTVFIMNKINLDYSALYAVLLLAFVLFAFSFTSIINGNGYLAVYIAGLIVGNEKVAYKKSVITFFDSLTWLFQIVMFLTLGLLVNPSELISIVWVALAIVLFMTVFARPLSVFLCLTPFKKVSRQAKIFVSWVGLRGAVPIIFATYPFVAGVPHSKEIFNIVFFITIISLVLQGTSVPYVARLLGLTSKEEDKKTFALDLPEDIGVTAEFKVGESFLAKYPKAENLIFKEPVRIVMIKREDTFLVPLPSTEFVLGDKILLLASKEEYLQDAFSFMGIEKYRINKD